MILRAENQRATEVEAKAKATRQEEQTRLDVLRKVQQDLDNEQQDERDEVLFIVNQWRITPTWMIEGRTEDAKRYSLAGLTAVYKEGIMVIAGPGVGVAEKVDRTKSDKLLTKVAAGITELARAAKEAGPPILSRHCTAACDCPAGHRGFHSLASTDDPTLVLRTCVQDGCSQTWRERA
ncbi:hypothetical protein [Amycolatopsis vastitatis]|nr:hypothetical protein [Amycolatopsis vastitatis]